MDTQRLVLLFIFGFSVLMLWEAWEKERNPRPAVQANAVPKPGVQAVPTGRSANTVPPSTSTGESRVNSAKGDIVRVRTNTLAVELNTLGASVNRVELLRHKDIVDATKNFVLLGADHAYFAQSGLTGEGLPNHRTVWRVLEGPRELEKGTDKLEVVFIAEGPDGIAVRKSYVFKPDSYVIDVALSARGGRQDGSSGGSHAYFQLVRDSRDPAGESAMMQTYTGPAVYTTEKAYQKIAFGDIDKGKEEYPKHATNGWVAMVQHYFVSAWLPPASAAREYYVRKAGEGSYAAGTIVALSPEGDGRSAKASLYVGAQEQGYLKAAAEGLDLVVDYGWLTIVAWPLFWLLDKFYGWSGNWGVAIILLTVAIKLAFFPLSAASYKSMAKMKLVTPRLTKIREMYAQDRQKMNQAMMELYRTEKINPLGGCFPILVQIPVFIALYWVLLAAVELRHAPFILWIKDLSAQDPFYVLPILMTASMVIQTKLNPVPPDPVQAKVMTFMPYVFSVFFFFFPAGLVLYWVVNNVLSILQQWQIQRMFDRDRSTKGARR